VDNKLNGCGCVHVLDDFLFVGQGNSPLCGQTLSSFLDLLTDIGLPIKQDEHTHNHLTYCPQCDELLN
jgi:hypothetical protein